MESKDLAQEIRNLCRLIVSTDDPQSLQCLCQELRALLYEQTQQANDPASEALAEMLEQEDRYKKAS